LLTLAAREGTVLRLAAEGEDSSEALAQLETLIRNRFGEEA
jgi:phosphotransferase system HPr-like phosphotransfer protein